MKKIRRYLAVLLAMLFFIFGFIGCTDTKTKSDIVRAPQKIISIEKAKEMYDVYSNNTVPMFKEIKAKLNDTAFEPTRYGWYDYKTIKQYLAFIEQEAKQSGVEISGLQFYFTSYPDKEKFSDGSPVKYPGKNSFFIIPTMNTEGKDYGFYTVINNKGVKQAMLVKDKIQQLRSMKAMSTNISTDSTAGEQSLIINESNLVQPPNPDTDFESK